jgi:hypothetical protein
MNRRCHRQPAITLLFLLWSERGSTLCQTCSSLLVQTTVAMHRRIIAKGLKTLLRVEEATTSAACRQLSTSHIILAGRAGRQLLEPVFGIMSRKDMNLPTLPFSARQMTYATDEEQVLYPESEVEIGELAPEFTAPGEMRWQARRGEDLIQNWLPTAVPRARVPTGPLLPFM